MGELTPSGDQGSLYAKFGTSGSLRQVFTRMPQRGLIVLDVEIYK